MSITGLDVFDKTVHETNLWVKDVLSLIGGEDRHRAYVVLRAGLHALRDRLGPVSAAQFAAQLPILLRGVFFEGWKPTDPPTKERHKEDFFAHVAAELPAGMKINLEEAVAAIFAVAARHVSSGETEKIKRILPAELRELWL